MNRAHEDGSMTIDNASVQRLMDYNLLHYTGEGWVISMWPETPSAKAIEAGTAKTAQTGLVHESAVANGDLPKGGKP